MSNETMRIIKIGGLAVVVLTIVVAGFLLFRSTQFRVTETAPDINEPVPAAVSAIKVTFSKSLSADFTLENLSGDDIVEDLKVSDNALVLFMSPLEADREYELVINNIYSENGEELTEVDLGFGTRDIPFYEWENDTVELELEAQDRKKTHISDILPYSAEYYEISYDVGTSSDDGDENIIIRIDMKFTEGRGSGEYREAYLNAVREHRQNALDYIEDHGFDLEDYTISYGEDELINEFPGEFNVQAREEPREDASGGDGDFYHSD